MKEKIKCSYSLGVLDYIKSKNKLSDLLIENGYHLIEGTKSYLTQCPFCKDKARTFAVIKDKQLFNCFSCGENGDIYSFLMKIQKMSLTEATEYLADRAKICLPDKERLPYQSNIYDELFDINKQAALYYIRQLHSDDQIGINYLKNIRKLNDKTIQLFGLGFARKNENLYDFLKQKGFSKEAILASGLICVKENGGKFDRFRNRIIFPIINENGKVVGFNGRALDSSMKAKYLNTPETLLFDKHLLLYGENRLKKNTPIILCEGNFDVISCVQQQGLSNVVATLGTALSVEQVQIIKGYTNQLYLIYDSDDAGKKATQKVFDKFSEQLSIKSIDVSPYKDVDEALKNGVNLFNMLKTNDVAS